MPADVTSRQRSVPPQKLGTLTKKKDQEARRMGDIKIEIEIALLCW